MNTLKLLRLLGPLCGLVFLSLAHGTTFDQNGAKIIRIGSHIGNQFFVSLDQGLKSDCQWGLLYCMADNPNCKMQLALAMQAKATDRPVHLWYDQTAAGAICTINLVEIPQ